MNACRYLAIRQPQQTDMVAPTPKDASIPYAQQHTQTAKLCQAEHHLACVAAVQMNNNVVSENEKQQQASSNFCSIRRNDH